MADAILKRGFTAEDEGWVPFISNDVKLGFNSRVDLVVRGLIVVELRAKSAIHPVDEAQLLSQLKLHNLRFGLLIHLQEVQ